MAGARFDLAIKSILSGGKVDGPSSVRNSIIAEGAKATRKLKEEL